MKSLFLHFNFALVLAVNALAYGNSGHEAVGMIAAHYLKGTRAGNEVLMLLKPNEGLDRAATWADRAKFPDKYLTHEMKEYVANNPAHHSYHYCDIPFQEYAYHQGITGTNDKDIIHSIQTCIQVLDAPEDNKDNAYKINKRIALLLLVHFIGDLHQPLHVGCSYVDDKNQFVNPETGAKGQPDAGANYFRVKTKSGTSLHGYWDTLTVKAARSQAGGENFTDFLIETNPPKADWKRSGPLKTWPVEWTNDSLMISKKCFEGIVLHDRFFVPKNEKHEAHFEWIVTLPTDYTVRSRDIVEMELSKAGYRLAELLKAIWPEKL